MVHQNIGFWVLEIQNGIGHILWPINRNLMTSDQRLKTNIHYLANWLSKHRFLGNGIRFSFWALLDHISWPLIRGQNLFLPSICFYICFLGQWVQFWPWFFTLTSWKSYFFTSDLRWDVKAQFLYLLWCMSKHMFLGPKSSNMAFDLFIILTSLIY